MMPSEGASRAIPGEPKPLRPGNGKTMIALTDPEGYRITLDIDTWETHIIVRHPEVRDYLDLLKKTVQEPELIQGSRRSTSTFYYYRMAGIKKWRRNDLYFAVVVHRDSEEKSGFVRTAHLVKQPHKDGDTIWLKRS